MADTRGSALSKWTVVQSNIDLATAAATDGADVKGISGYETASVSVTSNGWVQVTAKQYVTSIGNGRTKYYTVTHNLNSNTVMMK